MLSLLCQTIFATVAVAVSDTVDLTYSQYRGQSLSTGITQWEGMRYAAPPVGSLRFTPPRDPLRTYGVQEANKAGFRCLGTSHKVSDVGKSESEDCLFINVQAPTNATEESKLPVFLYIQGGGFNINSDHNINATGLIQAADNDLIVVDFNYRVGPYGFLTDGNQVTTNNGLRDQRKAMEWVQAHIHKFGGNPDHVVLGGTSAGAASISLHLTANNGRDLGLFHGAIAESPSYATTLTVSESYYQYKQLVTRLGCAGSDSLACLRNRTAVEIQTMNYNIPFPGGAEAPAYLWEPAIDGEYVPDFTQRLFAEGKFIKVPTIFGDVSNGGTKFCPSNTSTLAESNLFMLNQYPFLRLGDFDALNDMYPNPNNTCPSQGCYWRQVSNVYQEARYMCPALQVTASMASRGVKNSYAYRWNVGDPAQLASGQGVPHVIEFQALLGPKYADKDVPESYLPGGINEKATPVIQGYWTSFMRTLDPNTHRHEGSARWRTWEEESDARLLFDVGAKTSMEKLGSLKKRCDFWIRNAVAIKA